MSSPQSHITVQTEKTALPEHPNLAQDTKECPQNPLSESIPEHVSETDTNSTGGLERWNGSPTNRYRFFVTNFSLFIMGMNDACIGVSLLQSTCTELFIN
jgi:hypothetical protein